MYGLCSSKKTHIMVYVDDLLFTGEQEVNRIFTQIQKEPGSTVSFFGKSQTEAVITRSHKETVTLTTPYWKHEIPVQNEELLNVEQHKQYRRRGLDSEHAINELATGPVAPRIQVSKKMKKAPPRPAQARRRRQKPHYSQKPPCCLKSQTITNPLRNNTKPEL